MREPHATTDPRAFVRLAEEHLPSVRIRSARPIDMGWCNFVLDVNDEWILRFPRTPEDSRRVESEVRILPALEARLPVPVPHYEHIVRDGEGRILIVAYPKLKGRPLPTRKLDGPRAKVWAADILAVLAELQRFSRPLGRRLGIEWSERRDRRGRWNVLYPWVRERIHPLLSDRVRERDREAWDSYLSDEPSLNLEPSLTHGDLSPEHTLVDDRGITGILDWESACFEDPVGDVTGLPQADGFAESVCVRRFGDEDWRRRVAFHRHASPAYNVLYGLDTNEPARVKSGLTQYVRTLPR